MSEMVASLRSLNGYYGRRFRMVAKIGNCGWHKDVIYPAKHSTEYERISNIKIQK